MCSVRTQEPVFWAASELAKAGYPVFPVKGKEPTVEGGFYAATTDQSQIAEWIEDGRGHHDPAIPTGIISGVVVIDTDTADSDAWMRQRYGPPQAKTKRGGHWGFRHPRDGKVSSTALSELMPGLDRKGDGGYVVVPPGRGREWTAGIPEISSLPVLPEELRGKSRPRNGEPPTLSGEGHEEAASVVARHVSRLAEGQRHEHLRHLLGSLLNQGVGAADAEAIARTAWEKAGGELSERAATEVPNTVRTTEAAVEAGHATGVPSMEGLTPGLWEELRPFLGLRVFHAEKNGSGPATTAPERPFPEMDPAAYRGVFGELVELISPHSEADPVAVLLGAITAFGSAYGRRGYMDVSGARHHGNLFVGIVGNTARSRKGTSWAPIENIFSAADPEWGQKRIDSGLSSGEGLINAVRDKIEVPDGEGNTKVSDPGVKDKRLLVSEGELAQGLKVLRREGNTLSPILRNAWDGRDLSTLVRHSPLKATGPHISVLGHITESELLKHLVESETANGFGNRILWAVVRRSKRLPFGGELETVDMAPVIRRIRNALGREAGRMRFADNARDTWAEMYAVLTQDRPGMFGEVTARAEAQTLRLAIIYALADGSGELRAEHLASACAVWGYCEDSALYLFGDRLGDADADNLAEALRQSEDGMTRTEISAFFKRNKLSVELDRILGLLLEHGKARREDVEQEGSKKPVERWYAA